MHVLPASETLGESDAGKKEEKSDTELDTTLRPWRSAATVLCCTCLLSGGFGRSCLVYVTWQEVGHSNGNGNAKPTVVVAVVVATVESLLEALPSTSRSGRV